MIYNNLIYFLVVIFVFSAASVPENPWPAGAYTLPALGLVFYLYHRIAAAIHGRAAIYSAAAYFSAERKLSIIAVLFFSFCVYGLDIKYYLHFLAFDDKLPALVNTAGLGFFFLFLAIMWAHARSNYQEVFHRQYTLSRFLRSNINVNLPIVLPWLALSFLFDFLALLPFTGLDELLNSPWGDLVLFGVFMVFLVIIFPPLVRRLWNCKPLPAGSVRAHITEFCRRQGFSSEILLWPLFEGRVITAGIMGFIKGFRYLLLTPALLDGLTEAEIEAVVAHEIGHVKRKHLFLYILLFLGFSLLAGFLAEPLHYLILNSSLFYILLDRFDTSPEAIIAVLGGIPLLALLLIYFRFIFGYFIRNFERQADLHVFTALGHAGPLVSAFEKIAVLSGNIRNQKSWHHFGIGERIDFLFRCERNRTLIRRHDRKVAISMALYFVLLAGTVAAIRQMPMEELVAGYEMKYMEAVLRKKIKNEPRNALWHQLVGDLMQDRKMEIKALAAYEKALALEPVNAVIMNNLAWLLLTAEDREIRQPRRALTLARSAAALKEEGYILDTLAVAFWANGLGEEAVNTEMRAIRTDPENRKYYQAQIAKFKTQFY